MQIRFSSSCLLAHSCKFANQAVTSPTYSAFRKDVVGIEAISTVYRLGQKGAVVWSVRRQGVVAVKSDRNRVN
jgi:hypothetical protein